MNTIQASQIAGVSETVNTSLTGSVNTSLTGSVNTSLAESVNTRVTKSVNTKLTNRDSDAETRKKAIEVAHLFEEFFVQMMVESFRKSQLSEDDGMFGKSVGSNTYEQWFDQHMSKHIAKSSSIGIAATLIRDFQRLGQMPPEKGSENGKVNHVA